MTAPKKVKPAALWICTLADIPASMLIPALWFFLLCRVLGPYAAQLEWLRKFLGNYYIYYLSGIGASLLTEFTDPLKWFLNRHLLPPRAARTALVLSGALIGLGLCWELAMRFYFSAPFSRERALVLTVCYTLLLFAVGMYVESRPAILQPAEPEPEADMPPPAKDDAEPAPDDSSGEEDAAGEPRDADFPEAPPDFDEAQDWMDPDDFKGRKE